VSGTTRNAKGITLARVAVNATKDQQVKHVVEGLVLGVLAQGVEAVTSNKQAFTFAFNDAWRSWSRVRHFPSISAPFPGDLFWLGVHKSEGRRAATAAWDSGRWSVPHLLAPYADWTIDECLELHADDRASADDWKFLGALYVSYFKPDEIRRVE
jgi:hypothetical protein